MDRRISVGSSRWDGHRHRTQQAGAPNTRPGTLQALQPHMPGRPHNPAAPRTQGHNCWLLHCPRQRQQQLRQQRRRRQHSRNNVPRQAAPPTEKPRPIRQRQVRARSSCSSGRLPDTSLEPTTPAAPQWTHSPLRFRRFLSNFLAIIFPDRGNLRRPTVPLPRDRMFFARGCYARHPCKPSRPQHPSFSSRPSAERFPVAWILFPELAPVRAPPARQ